MLYDKPQNSFKNVFTLSVMLRFPGRGRWRHIAGRRGFWQFPAQVGKAGGCWPRAMGLPKPQDQSLSSALSKTFPPPRRGYPLWRPPAPQEQPDSCFPHTHHLLLIIRSRLHSGDSGGRGGGGSCLVFASSKSFGIPNSTPDTAFLTATCNRLATWKHPCYEHWEMGW